MSRGERHPYLENQGEKITPRTNRQKRANNLKKVRRVAGNTLLAAGVAAGAGYIAERTAEELTRPDPNVKEMHEEFLQSQTAQERQRDFKEWMKQQGIEDGVVSLEGEEEQHNPAE